MYYPSKIMKMHVQYFELVEFVHTDTTMHAVDK